MIGALETLLDRIRPRRGPPPHEALRHGRARRGAITVWGFLNSPIGLGSSARGLIAALDGVRKNVQRHAIPLPDRDGVPFATSRSVFRTRRNIVVVQPPEMMAPDFAPLREHMAGSHRIAYWAWELERVPDRWTAAFDLVDEIWTCSDFSAAALRRATRKPVHVVHHLVEDWAHLPADAARARLAFMPRDGFVFLFALDFQSGFARKNPLGIVDAFVKAFGDGPEGPHLVLKYHSAAGFPREEHLLREAAGRCGRIRLVDAVLRPAEMRALHDAADCFVSLHRAEGFGLGIAEAMVASKPVVCTRYSGNMDFTDETNALLVGCADRAVGSSDYEAGEGQSWAEPDLGQAAWAMRRIVEDPLFAHALAQRGRDRVLTRLGKPAVAARMTALLAASEGA